MASSVARAVMRMPSPFRRPVHEHCESPQPHSRAGGTLGGFVGGHGPALVAAAFCHCRMTKRSARFILVAAVPIFCSIVICRAMS